MAKELRYYECSVCGKTYLAEREAIECEIECVKGNPSAHYRIADALISNGIAPCDFCNCLEIYGSRKKCVYKKDSMCAFAEFYPYFHPLDNDDIAAAIGERIRNERNSL